VRYLGVCCGAAPHHIRAMAEALGRKPAASRYSEDMSKHYVLGSDPSFRKANTEYRGQAAGCELGALIWLGHGSRREGVTFESPSPACGRG